MSPRFMKSALAALLLLGFGGNGGLYAQANKLSLSSSTLQFFAQDAETTVPSQTVLVSSAEGPVSYETEVGYLSSVSGWLSVSRQDAKIVVTVAPHNLANGLYMGFVKLISGPTEVAFVTVTLKVGNLGAPPVVEATESAFALDTPNTTAVPTMTLTPSELSFQATTNGPKVTQTITVTSSIPGGFYINVSGGLWLSAPQDDFITPKVITITADPGSIKDPTTLGGFLSFVGFGTLSGISRTATISLNVTAGTGGGGNGLTVSPTSLNFQQTVGGTAPPTQSLSVTGGSTSFTATSNKDWLTVTSSSTTAPATLTVAVNGAASGLITGINSGTITISGGNTTITVPVNFLIESGVASVLTAAPSSLSFSQTLGEAVPDSKTVSLTSNIATTYTAAVSSGSSWLTATVSTGTATTATLTVSANASGLGTGTYQASVTVTAGTGKTAVITITFSVTGIAPTLTATPTAVSLSQVLSGPLPGAQIVIDSATPTIFIAHSNASWLTVTPATTITTPTTLSVFVSRRLLAVGTYYALITVTGGTSPITVPVTLTITSPAISASPAALSFAQTIGLPTAAPQTVSINSAISTNFSATSNANWLVVTPASGITPGPLTVSIVTAGLVPGTYPATISIGTGTAAAFTVPVTLTLTAAATSITAQPETVSFTASATSTATPQPQTVTLTSPGSQFAFKASASTVSGGSWLTVTPLSGITPASLTVAVSLAGLKAGQYTGAITITPTDTTVATKVLVVALNITSGGTGTSGVTVRTILNAASLQPGALAPGEIISIFGTGLGPLAGQGPILSSSGSVGSTLADTRVLFDGVAAPLLYAGSEQINAIVPYGINGRFATSVQVEVAGNRSEALQLRVDPASPALFTATGTGKGQGAVVNQDGTLNNPFFPAPRETIIALYGTGEGQTRPAGQDGRIITTDVRPPVAPVSVTVGGLDAEVKYAGSAPGMVSGAFQINVLVPRNAPVGGQIPIEVTIGGILSQLGVTVSIK